MHHSTWNVRIEIHSGISFLTGSILRTTAAMATLPHVTDHPTLLQDQLPSSGVRILNVDLIVLDGSQHR